MKYTGRDTYLHRATLSTLTTYFLHAYLAYLDMVRGALLGVVSACCSNWASRQLTGEARPGDELRSSTSAGVLNGEASPMHGRPFCGTTQGYSLEWCPTTEQRPCQERACCTWQAAILLRACTGC